MMTAMQNATPQVSVAPEQADTARAPARLMLPTMNPQQAMIIADTWQHTTCCEAVAAQKPKDIATDMAA